MDVIVIIGIGIMIQLMCCTVALGHIGKVLERIANAIEYQTENWEWVLPNDEEEEE